MSAGGNAASAGSAVSSVSNHPVNKCLPSGIYPCKIRMDMELIAIDNDTRMDNSEFVFAILLV